jgi:nitrogen fixation/metabolism regulation signal transduction histidine kinase
LDRISPDRKEHELLKTIERQGPNDKRIVEKFMIYAGQPGKQEEISDIDKDIEMVTSLQQNNLFPNKIGLALRLARELPWVRKDSGELQQMFINLVNNAVAARPTRGKLSVIIRINPYNHLVEALHDETRSGAQR